MKTLFIIAAILTSLQCFSQQSYDTIPANGDFGHVDFKQFKKAGRSYVVINGDTSELGNPVYVGNDQGAAVQIIGDTSYTKWLITIRNHKSQPIQVKVFQRCIIGQGCIYVDQRRKETIGNVKILSFTQNGW